MSIEQRIRKLEAALKVRFGVNVPGTVLTRCFDQEISTGLMWSLGIGALSMPKKFYVKKTIAECLSAAEKEWC